MNVEGAIFREVYRCTMGLCLGLRGGLNSAIVVLACRRDDPARKLYVVHEWEQTELNVDDIAAALKDARRRFHTVFTVGYHGGKDDEAVFKVLSVRLGQHVEPAPGDQVAPTQLLVDDFRQGRLKARPDSMVARDTAKALWVAGTPGQTGVLAALRCAHWAAQQYRQRDLKPRPGAAKHVLSEKERRRRMERPY